MLLSVENLKAYFHTENSLVRAVDDVSFQIDQGQTVSLVGESGCGKSLTALSIMRLVAAHNFFFEGGIIKLKGKDLLQLDESKMRQVRGNHIAMIFQEPAKNLNPVLSIGYQLMEPFFVHHHTDKKTAKKKALELLDMVKIPNKQQKFEAYPHQLSGGMKQRIMIAIAIACDPVLLIADEPTTALDLKTETEILNLIQEIQKERKMAMLLITHDLGVASRVSDSVIIIYAGKVIEQLKAKKIFKNALHPYSYKLLRSLPIYGDRKYYLESIKDRVPSAENFPRGCRFAPRCELKKSECEEETPPTTHISTEHRVACFLYGGDSLKKVSIIHYKKEKKLPKKKLNKTYIEVKNLRVYFDIKKGIFKRWVGHVKAVDNVSFDIPQGSTLALMGTSGCGKTTLGRAILQLVQPTSGVISCNGKLFDSYTTDDLRKFRCENQIIFQDPFSSLNPKMTIRNIIAEGIMGLYKNNEIEEKVDHYMTKVGLEPSVKFRHPHEFSGGQRQRIGIARSLIVEPRFIVCDEVTSALDVSVQAQILNLLEKLQIDLSLTYLFISHNQPVIQYLADRTIEMHAGKIVNIK